MDWWVERSLRRSTHTRWDIRINRFQISSSGSWCVRAPDSRFQVPHPAWPCERNKFCMQPSLPPTGRSVDDLVRSDVHVPTPLPATGNDNRASSKMGERGGRQLVSFFWGGIYHKTRTRSITFKQSQKQNQPKRTFTKTKKPQWMIEKYEVSKERPQDMDERLHHRRRPTTGSSLRSNDALEEDVDPRRKTSTPQSMVEKRKLRSMQRQAARTGQKTSSTTTTTSSGGSVHSQHDGRESHSRIYQSRSW